MHGFVQLAHSICHFVLVNSRRAETTPLINVPGIRTVPRLSGTLLLENLKKRPAYRTIRSGHTRGSRKCANQSAAVLCQGRGSRSCHSAFCARVWIIARRVASFKTFAICALTRSVLSKAVFEGRLECERLETAAYAPLSSASKSGERGFLTPLTPPNLAYPVTDRFRKDWWLEEDHAQLREKRACGKSREKRKQDRTNSVRKFRNCIPAYPLSE